MKTINAIVDYLMHYPMWGVDFRKRSSPMKIVVTLMFLSAITLAVIGAVHLANS